MIRRGLPVKLFVRSPYIGEEDNNCPPPLHLSELSSLNRKNSNLNQKWALKIN